MTQLELVEHDLNPCGEGKPIIRQVVAVSSSYSALVEHCKETYGSEIGHEKCNDNEMYYTIHESKIVIVPSKF
jgi:hypothetical protein